MYIPRLRYINDAVEELNEKDKKCPITYNLIRCWIKEGKLMALKYGSAWLVNMDELYALLWGKLK